MFKGFDGGQAKAIFDVGSYGFYYNIASIGKAVVVGIKWFGDDDFVAGVEARKQAKIKCFGATCCNDNVVVG